MKKLWAWFGSSTGFRYASLVMVIVVMVSELGRSGSYLKALLAGVTLLSIWAMGYYSHKGNDHE